MIWVSGPSVSKGAGERILTRNAPWSLAALEYSSKGLRGRNIDRVSNHHRRKQMVNTHLEDCWFSLMTIPDRGIHLRMHCLCFWSLAALAGFGKKKPLEKSYITWHASAYFNMTAYLISNLYAAMFDEIMVDYNSYAPFVQGISCWDNIHLKKNAAILCINPLYCRSAPWFRPFTFHYLPIWVTARSPLSANCREISWRNFLINESSRTKIPSDDSRAQTCYSTGIELEPFWKP